MQLSDVLKNTNALFEVLDEMEFEKYLEKISKLSDWEKKEIMERIQREEFTYVELAEIFDINSKRVFEKEDIEE